MLLRQNPSTRKLDKGRPGYWNMSKRSRYTNLRHIFLLRTVYDVQATVDLFIGAKLHVVSGISYRLDGVREPCLSW